MASAEIGAHSCSKDPKTLFLPDPERQVTWLHDKYLPIIGFFFGSAFFIYGNFRKRLPRHAGIWRPILGGIVGGYAGWEYHKFREERLAKYDAILHWYIQEHPEEFPTPVRVKVGDCLKAWVPIR